MKLSTRALLVLCILFWSGNYVVGRAIVSTIPPFTLTYVRWLVACIIFLPFCLQELKENWNIIKKNLAYFIVLGVTGIMGFNMFQYMAVKYTTAINATIINAATPMFTAGASLLFLKENLRWKQVIGIGLSFIGVLCILTEFQWQRLVMLSFMKGDVMMLIAVLINTVYYLMLKIRGRIIPPKSLFMASVLLGLLVTFPIPVIENYYLNISWVESVNILSFLAILYVGIFPSILSMLFFNRAIIEMGPVKTSIYTNLSIIFTSLLGGIFLGEILGSFHILGAVLIVLGVILTNRVNEKIIRHPKNSYCERK